MSAVVAVIVVGVVAAGAIIALGYVQAARTRAATRRELLRLEAYSGDDEVTTPVMRPREDQRLGEAARNADVRLDAEELMEDLERIRANVDDSKAR